MRRFWKREIPELNTTSTADISFMLLIFFLVTTSMDVNKGIVRQLPPIQNTPVEPSKVPAKDLMTIYITEHGEVLVDKKKISIDHLRQLAYQHIEHSHKGHLFSLDAHVAAHYDVYFKVQNALMLAYDKSRNLMAQKMYNQSFDQCTIEQQNYIVKECPQRVAEQYNDMQNK